MAAASVAERRLVSVLFADLVGFTPFAEERDAEEVRETLSRYFDIAREIIDRYGGTVEKFIGDAVMAVWGAPIAREDDAERAVRAALDLVDAVTTLAPGIQARAGVLTGEAAVTLGAVGEGMVAGDLVNTAARLQSVAPAGHGPRRRSDAAGGRVGHQLRGRRRAAAQGQGQPGAGLAGAAGRRPARWPRPFGPARAAVRRPRRGVPPAQGRARRRRPRSPSASRSRSRAGRYRQEPARLGAREVHRRHRRDIYWHRGRSPAYGEGITFWALGEMVRRRAGLAEGDDEATTRSRIATTVAEYVPEDDDRRWVEPALLTLLGLEPRRAVGASCSSPRGASSSSASPRAARPSSCSRTSSGPTAACSTSSSTSSNGRRACRCSS